MCNLYKTADMLTADVLGPASSVIVSRPTQQTVLISIFNVGEQAVC